MAYDYEDMDKLRSCPARGSMWYRSDSIEWYCWTCAPPMGKSCVMI